MTAALPELGIGLVYVPGLEPLLEPGMSCISAIEIEPEAFWHFRGESSRPYVLPAATREQLLAFPQRKLVHSVGFAVGGTQQPPPAFCAALAEIAGVLDAPWVSAHLSFTHFRTDDGLLHTGFMLPALQTVEGAETAARTIRSVAEQLPVPFAVETAVNYLAPRRGELSDGAFVARAVEAADCGILLDLHNIWTNAHNGRQPVAEFLSDIPLERVWEIHLGGGFEFGGYWLDAHSGPVPPPVLAQAQELIAWLPNLRSVVYEIYPSFVPLFGLDNVRRQLEDIAAIWARQRGEAAACREHTLDRVPCRAKPSAQAADDDEERMFSPERWERELGALVVHGEESLVRDSKLAEDGGIGLIRKLTWKFRASAIVQSLGLLTRLILIHSGDEVLERLLDGYFAQTPPQGFASEEARHFIGYLRGRNLDIPFLDDVMAYEESSIKAVIEQEPQYLDFAYDPRELVRALASGHLPDTVETGDFQLELAP